MECIRGVVENNSRDRASCATQEERAWDLMPRTELHEEEAIGLRN